MSCIYRIGDRVSATGYLTIGAVDSVVIEDDVLMASNIYIGDNLHGTARADVPYKYQPLDRISPVVVGRGSWIGEHVVILEPKHEGTHGPGWLAAVVWGFYLITIVTLIAHICRRILA